MSEGSNVKFIKKKKKKSYLTRAKKFGRSGRFGHGSHISEDIYNYFLRVVEINKGKFDTEEERDIFISNTFEQTDGEEVTLASNQFTSYALEQLIPNAKDEPLHKYMSAIATDLRPIVCDTFASHVIQSLLKASAERIQKFQNMTEESEDTDSWWAKYVAWILKVGRFLLNNIEEFAWNNYANQIMRTVLEVVSGSPVSHHFGKNPPAKKPEPAMKTVKVPKPLKILLKEYCETITALPQLPDMLTSPLISCLLQSLIQAAGKAGTKRSRPLCERLLQILRTKQELDEPTSRLLEAMLAASPAPIFAELYDEFFKGKLQELACNPKSNFSVQRLFDSCPDKDQLQLLLEELGSAEMIESVLKVSHTGVIVAMAQACHRLGSGQGTFIQSIMTVLQCNTPAERQMQVAPLILSLLNYEKFEKVQSRREEDDPPVITLHGSILVQALLKFNKPIKIVQSLLSMQRDDLKSIFCDSKGSHVADAFMNSGFVGEKSREKMVQHLKGCWADLACNKFGSRSLDSTWKASSVKARQNIVSELSQYISRLKSDPHGRFIVQECGVELFRHQPSDWADHQGKNIRNKRLFADILGDESDSKQSKKSKTS